MRLFPSILQLAIALLAAAPAAQARDLGDMSSTEIAPLQQRLTDGGCYQGAIDGQASPALQDAIKACPSQDPILRIETGMHVAEIKRIGVDRACRIAATGSYDKTIRLWSLPEGRLLRTLRVPIGPGWGGKIFATAVSPDGQWVAAGGWDAQWDVTRANYVYIFEASTGVLVTRVDPFGSSIIHLTFAPDGRWLAATSQAGVGLKVIDTQTWQIVATDAAYDGDSYGAAFAPDGRLYTIAYDHKLRQYGLGPAFQKEREVSTRDESRPFSIAIDPRGQLLAVGFDDSAHLDIYDAATLKFRFAADVRGIDNGVIPSVAWSSDGAHLLAAGSYNILFQGQPKMPLLTFGRDGQRIGGPLLLGDNSVQNLQSCRDAIAVAASDPAFGLVDNNSRIKLWKTSIAPNMAGKAEPGAFTIAADARQVRFGLGYVAAEPVLFNLAQGTIASSPRHQASLRHWWKGCRSTIGTMRITPHLPAGRLSLKKSKGRVHWLSGATGLASCSGRHFISAPSTRTAGSVGSRMVLAKPGA
jgi:WD40 repeat protein